MKLTVLPSQRQCAPKILPATLPPHPVAAARQAMGLFDTLYSAITGRTPLLPLAAWLLDRQLLPRRRDLLDQLELEDTIVVFGLARRVVQLRRERKATIDVAEIPLAAE
jgi:hypothetical protein